jgi:hypothetical protein
MIRADEILQQAWPFAYLSVTYGPDNQQANPLP